MNEAEEKYLDDYSYIFGNRGSSVRSIVSDFISLHDKRLGEELNTYVISLDKSELDEPSKYRQLKEHIAAQVIESLINNDSPELPIDPPNF